MTISQPTWLGPAYPAASGGARAVSGGVPIGPSSLRDRGDMLLPPKVVTSSTMCREARPPVVAASAGVRRASGGLAGRPAATAGAGGGSVPAVPARFVVIPDVTVPGAVDHTNVIRRKFPTPCGPLTGPTNRSRRR